MRLPVALKRAWTATRTTVVRTTTRMLEQGLDCSSPESRTVRSTPVERRLPHTSAGYVTAGRKLAVNMPDCIAAGCTRDQHMTWKPEGTMNRTMVARTVGGKKALPVRRRAGHKLLRSVVGCN